MILSSHIITATAVTMPLATGPITPTKVAFIFIVAFCSHYLLDLIPHWDYKLVSIKTCHREEKNGCVEKSKLKIDLIRTTLDGLLGIFISALIISLSSLNLIDKIIVLSIIIPTSILPDIIEVINIFFKGQPVAFLHKIHLFFHRKNIFMGQPLKGVPLQIAVLILIISFSFILQ
ncbi:MAG: hypothetical protein COU71_01960 [Parcubacteria group bacterium CG10_big_fil_rev_8_21_14_0_10_38_31]|nr:MAG: hypothetical protein COU71_01960 [Parcubacteria group bacterium CG10_big_fil_rev_8_21_14_0_10_38_31]